MNEQIKSYIEKILGISVQFHHWKGELELPFYITGALRYATCGA